MKKKLSILFVLTLGLSLVGCASESRSETKVVRSIVNGGFDICI